MKRHLTHILVGIFIGVSLMGSAGILEGCSNTATTQRAEYQTLATAGVTAKAAIDTAAQLLRAEKITVAQWSKVAAIYDNKFQPTYNLALAVAQTNINQPAPADLLAILNQLTALVASFK